MAQPESPWAAVVGGAAEAELAASYNALLESDTDLARRSYEGLIQGQNERGLKFGTRLLCHSMRPRLFTEERLDELRQIAEIVAGVFERAGDTLLNSPRLLDRIGATEQEREIWETYPGFPGFTLTSRLDSFMVGGVPQFVEYNAESPAGIAFSDELAEVFRSLPVMKQWAGERRLFTYQGLQALLDTLLWAYHEWGGAGNPSMAIVDWEDVVSRRDFEIAADYFRRQGCDVVICDPRRLQYRNGKLYLGDTHIDFIYRRVLLHEMLERADEARDLLQAYRDGAVCMVNSPRSKILHKKAVMGLLSAGELDIDISPREQEIIDLSIPWTRIMTAGRTTYAGQTIDLAQFVSEHRERLVLKPSDDYGGHGVVLGWEQSLDEWRRAVDEAMDADYVVQERVPVPQSQFPLWLNDHLQIVPMLVDTDPLLFRSKVGCLLTRISGSALLNVTAGTGSTTATFVVQVQEK